LKDGTILKVDKKDYSGFLSRPASWEMIVEKFNNLVMPYADELLREQIIKLVSNFENHKVKDLMVLLEKVGKSVPAKNLQFTNN
jgi:2-methylcitrate dehydratase